MNATLAPAPLHNTVFGNNRLRWLYVALLLLASIVNYVDRQTLSVLAVTVQRDLHLSDIQYGYIVQAFLFTYMIMYVLSGRWVDRFGARRTQATFLFGWSLADLLAGAATGFLSLAACRAALGAAEPGNYTASLRAVGDWFSAKERALAVGIYSMGGTLGAAIAVPLAAAVALRHGWRGAFVVTGLMGLAVAALWLLLYRDPPGAREKIRSTRPVPVRTLLRMKFLPELLFTRLLTDSVWYFLLFWIPKYFQEARGIDLHHIGTTVWVLYVGADLGSLAGGASSSALVSRFGVLRARFSIMLPCAACMIALSTVTSMGSTSAALVVLTLLALCHMAWMTNVTTMALDLYPSSVATTIQGMIGAASALGGLLSAGLIAWTVQHHGYRPIFLCLSLMHPIAACILFARMRGSFAQAFLNKEPVCDFQD